jgi:hypothetical protein
MLTYGTNRRNDVALFQVVVVQSGGSNSNRNGGVMGRDGAVDGNLQDFGHS